MLLSANARLEGSLSNKVIGAVDVLGRKDTQAFVANLLKTPDVHTKLVTKVEDLLSLLQFSAADAVLLSESAAKGLGERTRMSLFTRALPEVRVGRAAVAVLSPHAQPIVSKSLQSLDGATNRLIGIETWSTP
ncbi:MAG: hypothetical protein H7X95_07920 [Deltaproteobacteria bacterium]|nr:hypothetical protein [Deltaproteobacteria bacterium]